MHLTLHLAWELADSHITVNTICPGPILTPLAEEGTTPEYRAMVEKRQIPLGAGPLRRTSPAP